MEFYKAAWAIIEDDFIFAIKAFFRTGYMPKGVNATLLSLIPKQAAVQSMSDYRPISCCNMLYKVISKILANRLKSILPDLIAPNQCAFVEGRLLLENVLLATELVKDYHKDTISPRSAIKFDITKAFDTIQWPFVLTVLRAIHLPETFIQWILACISTAQFSVVINGEPEGFFHSNRGLRQGCSLSPYLYVIIGNVLSRMLDKAAVQGSIGYHPRCKDLAITHLCFADDLFVFTDGSAESIRGILEVFHSFGRRSGLHINPAKSSLYTAGRHTTPIENEATLLGIPTSSLPVRYLGLPLTTKSMNSTDFAPLVDKIRNRLLSWSAKLLSYAGRVQLIKSVIGSISNFWSSVFQLPVRCLEEIEQLCSRFLWSGSPNGSSVAKVAWEEVCRPKEEGGLGIRKLRDVSHVFALNLIWKLFTLSGSLWVAWTKRYLMRSGSFWNAPNTNLGSWIWRKLLKLRPQASSLMRVNLGDGSSTAFWFDHWLPTGRLIDIVGESGPSVLGIPLNAKVSDAVQGSSWNLRRSWTRRFPEVSDLLRSLTPPTLSAGADIFLWKHVHNNYRTTFSASNTWANIRETKPRVSWNRVVWFQQSIPRCGFITWLAIKDRLSTGSRMRSWGRYQQCILCGEPDETRDHLFFSCPYTFTIWSNIAGKLLGAHISPDWDTTLRSLQHPPGTRNHGILLRLAFQVTIYHLWRERNTRIHTHICSPVNVLTRQIDKQIRNRITSLHYTNNPRIASIMELWFSMQP